MKKFVELEYERPNIELWINRLNEMTAELTGADADRQIEMMREADAIKRHASTLSSVVYIRHTVNTSDEFYKEEQNFFDEQLPHLQEAGTAFQNQVLESKYRHELEEEFGEQAFRLYDMERRTFDPSIIEDLVEENKTGNEYSELVAAAQIELDGEVYTLSRLVPLMQSRDREMRKRASEAYFGYFEDHVAEFDDIYDRLVKIRHRIALKLGFNNFVELAYLRMNRSDYDSSDVERYRNAIKVHMVPFAGELNMNQGKRLGLDSLYYYDETLEFNTGNPTPKGEPEWLIARAEEMYSRMSEETREFFEFMTKYEMYDLLSKDNKASGGYCITLPDYKCPFIFANMNGTDDDVMVLTHEGGHALQNYMSREMKLSEYLFPTYEACEIHSMGMEFFADPYMEYFFGEDAMKYRLSHLEKSVKFFPYGALIDEFQHRVFENVEMTPTERRKLFRELEKEYLPYRDYGDNEFLESGAYFFKQSHLFRNPFYYIDYTLALNCALGYFRMSRENYDEALSNYLELCKLGGSKSFLELVKTTGMMSPFEEESILRAVETARDAISEIDDENF